MTRWDPTVDLESNKDPDAGLEKIHRVIVDASYRVHAGIDAKSGGSHQRHHHPAPIVNTELRSESVSPVAATVKETSAGGGNPYSNPSRAGVWRRAIPAADSYCRERHCRRCQ